MEPCACGGAPRYAGCSAASERRQLPTLATRLIRSASLSCMAPRPSIGSVPTQPRSRQRPGLIVAGSLLSAIGLSLASTPMLVALAAGEAGDSAAPPAPAAATPLPTPPTGPAVGQSPPESLPQPQPLRPPAGNLPTQTLRPDQPGSGFDQSLDQLEREGAITPSERKRGGFSGAKVSPSQQPAFSEACKQGAISARECAGGVVVQFRGRSQSQTDQLNARDLLEGDGTAPGGLPTSPWSQATALGTPIGAPLTTPLTVPVSALLAGEGGSFSLASVFGRTPRPAPTNGNGNRRLLFPLIGSAVTSSEFGYRLHPVLGSWLMHAGKDLAAPEGTPVVAALSGRVVSSGLAGGYGLAIEVEHDNPRRRTLYGHLSELYVKAGERVRQGEVIGRVGSTGLSTGPHLHFELRQPGDGGWVAVDPGDLDPGSAATGSDAIATLMGQLLQRLERPKAPLQARAGSASTRQEQILKKPQLQPQPMLRLQPTKP